MYNMSNCTFRILLGLAVCNILNSLNQTYTIFQSADASESFRIQEEIDNSTVPKNIVNIERVASTTEPIVTSSISKERGKHGNEIKVDQSLKNPRKAVKLTMKQGVIMNQIISTYSLTGVRNALCKNHTEEFKLGLRALQPWALQIIIPSKLSDVSVQTYPAAGSSGCSTLDMDPAHTICFSGVIAELGGKAFPFASIFFYLFDSFSIFYRVYVVLFGGVLSIKILSKVFDSSSKVNSGILNGNLAEYGAYRQCLNIYEDSVYGPIRGRHCSFRITPTESLLKIVLGFRNVSEKRFDLLKSSVMDNIKLIWSVCVPDSCHSEDIFPHINRSIIEITEGLNLTVSLKEEHCMSLADEPKLEKGDYAVIFLLGGIVMTVAISTVIDYANNGNSNCLVNSFSAYANGKRLFSTESKVMELECLNGLRYISISYVVIGHRYIQNMVFPTANSIDLIDWVERYFSTTVIGGTVSVDTFFLIASTLVGYHFFLTVTKTNKFNLIPFYLYRNIRICMPLAVVTAIYATVLNKLGSGPTWYDYSYGFQRPCQDFWWSTLLHLQSYINPDALCIVQVWYLTDDMLFYYLSPIITIPLWKWPILGYINAFVIYILSIISSFWVAWSNEFDGGMPITSRLLETKYFQRHYITPHARAPPYVLGLFFGFFLYKRRGKQVPINTFVSLVCWGVSGFAMAAVVLMGHVFHAENYRYNRMFSSLFLSCSRSVWTMGLMWIIFSCVNGNGGIVNFILSHPIFKILGRLAYSVYLLHYMFQSSMQAARKSPQYFSDFLSIYMACSDVLLMTVVGIPFTLCFEYPFVGLATVLMRNNGRKSKIQPQEDIVKQRL